MSVPRSVADVIQRHVKLEVEGIDRMYLNVYQPNLQSDKQVAAFFRYHRQQPVPSSALMGVMTQRFPPPSRRLRCAREDPGRDLREGRAEGRCRRRVPGAVRQDGPDGRRPLRRQSPGEGRRLPHPATHRRRGPEVSVDRQVDGDGQSVLLLLRRRRLRSVLPEVLQLLPVQRQAVHQRPRVHQTSIGEERHCL